MNGWLTAFHGFLLTQLPPPPARILEIGCGAGDLARSLADDGYEVVAIDPNAPAGALFRTVRLEDFTDGEGFDAVVASLAIHHLADLDAGLDRIAELLRPDGILVLAEFAKERIAGPTARWYFHQRRALAEVGRDERAVAADFDSWRGEFVDRLADVHTFADIHVRLGGRFVERSFSMTPFLYSYMLDEDLEPVERALIEAGAIEATGVLYAGVQAHDRR